MQVYDIDGAPQEIFDRVVKHFAQQKRVAVHPVLSSCKYRIAVDATVLKCAAGALIPDEKYDSILEGHDFCRLLDSFWDSSSQCMVDPFFTCNPALVDLITALQMAHDYSRGRSTDFTPKELLINELRAIVIEFNLDGSLIDTIIEWAA